MAIPHCLHMMYNFTLFHSLFLINHYAPCWGNLKETLLPHSKISGASGKDSQPAINNRLITVLLWFYPYYREGSGRCHEKTYERLTTHSGQKNSWREFVTWAEIWKKQSYKPGEESRR